jgi:translation initiation factor IF-2
VEAPEVETPTVISKIDLSAIDSSTRPKKTVKKKDAAEEAPAEPKPAAKSKKKDAAPAAEVKPVAAAAPAPAEEDAAPTIENIKADKLEGPKILGKIDLPVNSDTRPKPAARDEKRKRKRIPVDKKGDNQQAPQWMPRAGR